MQPTDDTIPYAAFDGAVAIVGRIGSGKSFTARGIVERWLDEGRRLCIVDPTAVWHGLRSNVAGDGPGYPVTIFGGDHADIPISERSGELIAQILATRNIPAVIVTADMSASARHRFMADFLPVLFRANKEPLHLVLDEADDVAPQNPLPENRRMLGDVERIVRRGRVRGFRVMMITQRPAVLNKNVLTQVGTLVAMRLPAPQDRDAVEGWIKGQADVAQSAEVLGSLSSLSVGEGWIWAPDLGVLRRTKFPAIRTFDSMRTPEVGTTIAEPTRLAPVDIEELRALFTQQQTPESAVPQDTASAAWQAGHDAAAAMLKDEMARVERLAAALRPLSLTLGQLGNQWAAVLDILNEEEEEAPADEEEEPEVVAGPPIPLPPGSRPRKPVRVEHVRVPATDGPLPTAAVKMLAVLANGLRLTWTQITTLADLAAEGGYFNTGRKALRDRGLIVEAEGRVSITAAGVEASGGAKDPPDDLAAYWRASLDGGAGRVFDALRTTGAWIDLRELAAGLSLTPSGGYWNTAISTLRRNELVEMAGANIRLNPKINEARL